MKKTALLFLVSFFVFAAPEEKSIKTALTMDEAKAFLKEWLPAWKGGKKVVPALLDKYYTKDAVYEDPNRPKGVPNKDSEETLQEFFELFFDANSPDWEFKPVTIWLTEKGFVMEYLGRLPVKGTDKVIENFRGLDVLEFRDGKISRQKGFFDRSVIR